MLRKALSGLACASMFACTASGGGRLDGGAPDTCSSDAECPARYKCDREQRRCVCTGDDACPGGFCSAFTGLCVATVPGCTSDSVCAKGEYCDRAVRSCRPVTPLCGACRNDAQCGEGSRCSAHPDYPQAGTYCVPQCQAPADGGVAGCANGLSCRPRDAAPGAEKLCFPAQGACGVTNACTPDSRKPCQADADCADQTQVCDRNLRWCVTRVRTCPAGDACDPQQRICVRACSNDADCQQIEGAPGYQCIANACVRRRICSADADCTDGENCQPNPDGSKSCVTGCVQNADCPLGQSCDKTDPRHPKCVQGCAANGDCPLNAICVNKTCQSSISGCDQTCQTTVACSIASSCDSTSCCAAANLGTLCPMGPTRATQCQQHCTSAGCPTPVTACDWNCFAISFKACTTQNDCDQKYPGTVCTASKLCQVMMHIPPIPGQLGNCTPTDPKTCALKGFRCRARSLFGCTGGDYVCMPDVEAAAVACLKGTL